MALLVIGAVLLFLFLRGGGEEEAAAEGTPTDMPMGGASVGPMLGGASVAGGFGGPVPGVPGTGASAAGPLGAPITGYTPSVIGGASSAAVFRQLGGQFSAARAAPVGFMGGAGGNTSSKQGGFGAALAAPVGGGGGSGGNTSSKQGGSPGGGAGGFATAVPWTGGGGSGGSKTPMYTGPGSVSSGAVSGGGAKALAKGRVGASLFENRRVHRGEFQTNKMGLGWFSRN